MSTRDALWATDRAEAWAEGHLAGYQDRREERDYDPEQNPYRATAHTGEETRAAMERRRRHLAEMTRQAFADNLYETSAEDYAEALRRARGKNPAATTEDVRAEVERLLLRHGHAEWTEHDARTVAEVLDSAGLLATARTQPTREQIARALDRAGAFCGVCGREPGDPLDDCDDCRSCLHRYADAVLALYADQPTRDDISDAIEHSGIAISTSDAERVADAVLALFRGDDE